MASWLIGRGRVAAGVRPGRFAAWGLVAVDAVALMAVFALVLPPLLQALAARGAGVGATVAILFVVCFIPVQVILITSSLWASKSRWLDRPEKESD